jgi:hypothetical protein
MHRKDGRRAAQRCRGERVIDARSHHAKNGAAAAACTSIACFDHRSEHYRRIR